MAGVVRELFGTDGVRGVANRHPMTSEVALALGRALTVTASRRTGERAPRIVIGKDTRLSGYMIETAMASGVCSMGGQVLLVGPLPTPGISFITSSMRADAGVVISASHNPYDDNGIKLFAGDGFKLPDAEEAEIEALMRDARLLEEAPCGCDIGQATRIDDAVGRYVVELKHSFPGGMTLDGVKLVVDCANGAAYKVAPAVFRELGAEVIAVGVSPDGRNINHGCGSLHPEVAARKVVEHGADLGVTLDGDADRVILIDETGQVVDGDVVMALCATRLLREGRLANNTLFTTVMSNIGLDRAVQRAGGSVVRTQVGDRYVVEAMLERRGNFGGEQSGHLIFLDHVSTGDGIVGALQILAIMRRESEALSRLAEGAMERVPQAQISVRVPRKVPLAELLEVQEVIRSVDTVLGEAGRTLVRYSGTEAKARVLVEGPDEEQNMVWANRIADALVSSLQ
jgi:phosphoglucosamine mutase